MFGSFSDELLEQFKLAYAERSGKPCGASHISANKTCKIGGGSSAKRRPEEDVKRGGKTIGTSPRNMLIDNINGFKARLKDARSDEERKFLQDTIRKAEDQLKAEGG
jgi:hypothetical protein